MREIKFRAWDRDKREMVPWPVTVTPQQNILVFGGWEKVGDMGAHSRHLYELKDGIAMQYTGRKDKNGKEIYEGDVVIERAGAHRSVVEFRDGAFQVTHTHFDLSGNKTGEYEQPIGYLTDPVEVIGNIYESPELLTENV